MLAIDRAGPRSRFTPLAGTVQIIARWLLRSAVIPSASSANSGPSPGRTVFHVEFESATHAKAFAQNFAGQVIGGERPGAVAA